MGDTADEDAGGGDELEPYWACAEAPVAATAAVAIILYFIEEVNS